MTIDPDELTDAISDGDLDEHLTDIERTIRERRHTSGQGARILPSRDFAANDPEGWLRSVNEWLDSYRDQQPRGLDLHQARRLGIEINGTLERIADEHPDLPNLKETVSRMLHILFEIEPL